MSHKIVLVAIPAEELQSGVSPRLIDEIVNEKLEQYCEDMADNNEDIKMDYFGVGGRWHGMLCAKKGARDIYPSEGNRFLIDFSAYGDELGNPAGIGSYFVDEIEYIPATGARVKDIVWEYPNLFLTYVNYAFRKHLVQDGDTFNEFNALKADGILFIEDGSLYSRPEGENKLLYKEGETFKQYCERLEIDITQDAFDKFNIDAFVDKNGVWNDMDSGEAWDKCFEMWVNDTSLDLMELAKEAFLKSIKDFALDPQNADDYLVVVDCHAFP